MDSAVKSVYLTDDIGLEHSIPLDASVVALVCKFGGMCLEIKCGALKTG